ncbi:MAG: hypothetical protein U0441_38330 [Polyangiaceae bacterium]
MKDDAPEDSRTPSGRDPLDITASPTAVSLREPAPSAAAPSKPSKKGPSLRRWGLLLAVTGLCCVVVINVILISGAVSSAMTQHPADPAAAASASGVAAAPSPSGASTAAPGGDADADEDPPAPTAAPSEEPSDAPPPVASADPKAKKAKDARVKTVSQAAEKSCATSSVDGLSRQIIVQSRCIDPNAFVAVPRQSNLVTKSNVFLYMDRTARDRLVKVLGAHKNQTMTVHSALRTVAQQYLLRQWSLTKRCGITLATPPGESNHETGLALDIGEFAKWRAPLEAQGFTWLGSIDKVHFDYRANNASSRTGVDVMAFQQLWNRNHPDEPLVANGRYTAATEARLKSAPAGGFPIGAGCGTAPPRSKGPRDDDSDSGDQ